MAKWGSETGILRKRAPIDKHEELLVFGYACKLFREDEKAKFIDQGKHLIPWMGDEKLRIDRYDCRGALSDLHPFEANREGYDATRWLGLNESERKIELLCDEERYHALNSNEDEEEMYREEELKRLQQKTNEFSYSYDVPQDPDASQASNPPTVEEEDKAYTPSPDLDVPVDILIPKTEKENARIEKTALFVTKQGLQMEILIKAKQSQNPQFSFLNRNDPLHKYYRHVLNALKMGRYKVESAAEEKKAEDSESQANEDCYLHPSLLQSSVQPPLPPVPTVTYKPNADCSYSQLVNRIQGSQPDAAAAQNKPEIQQNAQSFSQLTYEQQQQYYQYYYAMQYYEYCKQLVAQFHSMGGTDGQTIPPHIQEQINTQATTFAQMAYTQYVQQNANNPYAQIAANVSQTKDTLNPYAQVPNAADSTPTTDISKAPIIYGQNGQEPAQQTPVTETTAPPLPEATRPDPTQPKPATKIEEKPLLSLVHYGSDSEDEPDEETKTVVDFKLPPDETKLVIDKMASYVSKNGANFENIVRSKGDVRFEFLNDGHEYHEYYRHKLEEYSGGDKSEEKESKADRLKVHQTKIKEKKLITPVSFSIKKPKEEIPKDIKSALPVEESDDENQEDVTAPPHQTIPPPELITTNLTLHVNPANETTTTTTTPPSEINTTQTHDKSKKPETKDEVKNGVDSDDPILEMIDLTDDIEERKDAKRAEDKIKDKLAAAVRGKLASVSKDRALQMERKKKAAAFLKLKSAESTTRGSKSDDKRDEDKVLVISDTENKSDNLDEKSGRSRSRTKHKSSKGKSEESDSEDGEIKKRRKSSKKKKSHHKRKRSGTRHRSRQHKKSKKKHSRTESHYSSASSAS